MKTTLLTQLFIALTLLFFIACKKTTKTHLITGTYINDVTKAGMPSEEFKIIKITDTPAIITSISKETTVKSTTTDANGNFNFGEVEFKEKSLSGDFKFIIEGTGDMYTDVYGFKNVSLIDLNENYQNYNFYIIPAFRKINVTINKIGLLNPGDTIYYSMESKYLQNKGISNSFIISGYSDYNQESFTSSFWKGPMGIYYINIYKRISGSVTILNDSVSTSKGQELNYSIDF